MGLTVVLALVAGTLAKLPHFFAGIEEESFYLKYLGGIVAGALICFFCVQRGCGLRAMVAMASVLAGSLTYLSFLPAIDTSDTSVLACLHLAVVFWFLVGVAFLSGDWKCLSGRMSYVRYNGELLIYSTVILIGGGVLTGLTIALFQLIELDITDWYMRNVARYGAVASPLVGTLIVTRIVGDRFRMAPLLAKVFTPLFLLMVIGYFVAMVVGQRSPFTDRDFFIAFNGLLLVVLGLCIFSISERGRKEFAGGVDFMNIGLVLVTLVINVIALVVILFRLSSYGFTPNRVAVLGVNLLVFCHLTGIAYYYVRFALGRIGCEGVEKWIVRYIPVYVVWSVVAAVLLPILFGFA
ncbi:MAG: hypothetical protein M2R45_04870 [Verrucomicrobia subdivision 3 bacterium]|nr:hypothetical protein [Limisphaerales bacterium]MCS1417523.1 hypothetical protein [Limisphaerales bacterium]